MHNPPTDISIPLEVLLKNTQQQLQIAHADVAMLQGALDVSRAQMQAENDQLRAELRRMQSVVTSGAIVLPPGDSGVGT